MSVGKQNIKMLNKKNNTHLYMITHTAYIYLYTYTYIYTHQIDVEIDACTSRWEVELQLCGKTNI